MSTYSTLKLIGPILLLWVSCATAQNLAVQPSPIVVMSPKGTSTGQLGLVIYKYTGNVKLRHQNVLFFCDQAIHYVAVNRIEAFGHVLIVQGDTITAKGDSLVYDGNKQQASLRGRVVLQDRRVILTTSRLDYNLASGLAHYANKGRLIDGRNVLTSREGYYDSRRQRIELQSAVKLVNPENMLTSEALIYSVVSRLATVVEPSRITNKEGVSVVRQGQFDTQSGSIQQSAIAETAQYARTNEPFTPVTSSDAGMGKSTVFAKNTNPIVASQTTQFTAAKEAVFTGTESKRLTAKQTLIATPKEKKSVVLAAAPTSQVETKIVGAEPAVKLSLVTSTVTPIVAGKAPVERQPMAPTKTAGFTTAPAPAKQVTDPVASLPGDGSKKSAITAAVQQVTSPVPVPRQRAATSPVNKRSVSSTTRVVPDSEESDLERELNRKKHFN